MSVVVGQVDVYDVAPSPDNRVRLSMILRAASFPDFAVDLTPQVASRIGTALLAVAAVIARGAPAGNQAAGGAHGG